MTVDWMTVDMQERLQLPHSDLAYPVHFYADPSSSGRNPLVTDLQRTSCTHIILRVFDYLIPLPIRIFFLRKIDVCGFKGEVEAKIKISPVVVFGVLSRMVLVRESWDAPFLLESQSNSRTSTETGWLRPTRRGFVCKMSLKAPFRSYKSTDDRDWSICCSLLDAESTGFGPKRLRCSVPPLFPIEHGWTSGHVLLAAQITWSPRQQATTFTRRFNSSSTRVQLEWQDCTQKRSNRLVSCTLQARWPADWCTQEHVTKSKKPLYCAVCMPCMREAWGPRINFVQKLIVPHGLYHFVCDHGLSSWQTKLKYFDLQIAIACFSWLQISWNFARGMKMPCWHDWYHFRRVSLKNKV